jgi:hypothetical protein
MIKGNETVKNNAASAIRTLEPVCRQPEFLIASTGIDTQLMLEMAQDHVQI